MRNPLKHLGSIWYHLGLVSFRISDFHYSQIQFLGGDFFAASYSKTALEKLLWVDNIGIVHSCYKRCRLIAIFISQTQDALSGLGRYRCMSRILRAFKAENKFTRHSGQISVEKFYEFKIGTPTPKFLGTAEAYFVCHIGPIFQISQISDLCLHHGCP